MEILFTTSQKPMARLIRKVTGECCSHVAIRYGHMVFHSGLSGVSRMSMAEFETINTIMHRVELPNTSSNIQKLYNTYNRNKGNMYDIGALLFVGIMLVLRKCVGLKFLPKQNLWQSTGMFMCTEFVTNMLDGNEDSLITPHKLYERIK